MQEKLNQFKLTWLTLASLFSIVFLIHGRSIDISKINDSHIAERKLPLLSNMAKKPVLKLDDLKPPDHIDAIRMEQDGDLNRDYKKEIFIGKHELVDNLDEESKRKKLIEIFKKVDVDNNNELSLREMEDWISLKINEHFLENHHETERIFKSLDADNDGYILWKEFHKEFLLSKGHKKEVVERQIDDYDGIEMSDDEKDELVNYKFRWTDADSEPIDNKLNVEEFKEFRHPEKSSKMIKRMVNDILENLDANKDGLITEVEFSASPKGDHHPHFEESDQNWQQERKREFADIVDTNHDGSVNEEELKNYVDPRNKQHSLLEAKNLLQVADLDRNGTLNLDEILQNIDLFFGSKFVDANSALHDEF